MLQPLIYFVDAKVHKNPETNKRSGIFIINYVKSI